MTNGQNSIFQWKLNGEERENLLKKLVENPEYMLKKKPSIFSRIMMYEDSEMINICIPFIANINAPLDDKNRTALHLSADRGLDDIALKLLKSGADIESRTRFKKETPLHVAARLGYHDIIDVLLKHGANINARDGMENTPLLVACKAHNVGTSRYNCILRILEDGPDVNARNSFKLTALMYTIINKVNAAEMDYICDILLKAGADPNLSDSNGNTPLHHLAWGVGGESEILSTADLLLKKGAFIDRENRDKETPLYSAFCTERWFLVDFLIENGASLSLLIEKGARRKKLLHIKPSISSEFCRASDVNNNIGLVHELFLIKHLAPKLANNYIICERAKKYIDGQKILKDFMEKCLKEVNTLKAKTIDGTKLTLCDILLCNAKIFYKLAKNKNIVSALKNCSEEFPIYGFYLKKKLNDMLNKLKEERFMVQVLHFSLNAHHRILSIDRTENFDRSVQI